MPLTAELEERLIKYIWCTRALTASSAHRSSVVVPGVLASFSASGPGAPSVAAIMESSAGAACEYLHPLSLPY